MLLTYLNFNAEFLFVGVELKYSDDIICLKIVAPRIGCFRLLAIFRNLFYSILRYSFLLCAVVAGFYYGGK